MQTVKPIIVGVDGSNASVGALREASEMATLLGCPLKAVTVWDMPVMARNPFPVGYTDFEDDARARLTTALRVVFGDDIPETVETVVVDGHPARVLIELSQDASMVVVGSRGHGGFAGMLLGSVSSAVAAHAKCPVLISHRADG